MHSRLNDFNAQRKEAGLPPIKIGIGLHEGRLMLGTIGENERMDGTVISDTVNTASRIEGFSKQFEIGVAVSERILLGLADTSAYHIRFIGKVGVKGRREEVSIFEIYDGDPEPLKKKKDSIKAAFERGLNAFYSQKYEQASEFFNSVLAELPDDQASSHYIRIMRKLTLSWSHAPILREIMTNCEWRAVLFTRRNVIMWLNIFLEYTSRITTR